MALYRQAARMVRGTVVEVGVAYGRSLAYLASIALPALRIVGVDKWADHMGGDNLPREVFEAMRSLGTPMQACAANLAACGLRDRVDLIHGASVQVAETFRDQSLDLVFLDGCHEYEHVRDDIAAWRAKVKPGGLLAGHDYSMAMFPGVVRAVEEAFGTVTRTIRGVVWSVEGREL